MLVHSFAPVKWQSLDSDLTAHTQEARLQLRLGIRAPLGLFRGCLGPSDRKRTRMGLAASIPRKGPPLSVERSSSQDA